VAIYYKVKCRIWRDRDFRTLDPQRQIEVIKEIVYGLEPQEFTQYRGPKYRVADAPKRRPDLYSAAWRAVRIRVIERQGTICRYCRKNCADDPTIDHVKPVCRGADPLDENNLVVCCRSCNSRKGGKEGW
jgi:hypothetical protein